MKTRIVNSKDLDLICMSALRYCDSCEDCDKVDKCELEEGVRGRVKKRARKDIEKANEFLKTFTDHPESDAVASAAKKIIANAKRVLKKLEQTRHPDIEES